MKSFLLHGLNQTNFQSINFYIDDTHISNILYSDKESQLKKETFNLYSKK